MKRLALLSLCLLFLSPLSAQTLDMDLADFVRTPAVTGYERPLAEKIRARIPEKLGKPQYDNMGNLYLTIGSGAPHRLIVAPMDEPGYVVSAITDDGYLRVQRLPQFAPHPLFDQLHEAQAVQIHTRSGKYVTGIVAGLSVHLQGGRQDVPRVNHPDNIYIDIGAASAAEARKAGVDLLDPIALYRIAFPHPQPMALRRIIVSRMGFGKLNAPAIGDRFAAAAIVECLARLDDSKLRGTLTVAFVAQQWANSRGLDRLLQHVKADEMVYVGRLRPQRSGAGQRGRGTGGTEPAAAPAQQAAPEPGAGVLLGVSGDAPGPFAEELERLAAQHNIPLRRAATAPPPRVSYTRGPEPPARFAWLSIPIAWPVTPAEFIGQSDLSHLAAMLEAFATGAISQPRSYQEAGVAGSVLGALPPDGSITTFLSGFVRTYGVSGSEQRTTAFIKQALPGWTKGEIDDGGNLILHIPASRDNGAKPKRILFVAHSDEIGYVVESIADDGRLIVRSRGGGALNFFAGHPMFVHSTDGPKPGVFELPPGWDQPGFEWPRGPQAPPLRIDVGARTAAQVAELGIKVGDTATIPKEYRRLLGTRANARSFDDRVGCAALVAAVWQLGWNELLMQATPKNLPSDLVFVWATREEVGLEGALEVAARMAAAGEAPDYVFAVDTFVSSDSPLESKRFANAPIGQGFVIRAVDNSNIAPREEVEKLIRLARQHNVPVQYGITGGGNDGAAFIRHGAVDIPIAWPLRYSHSPGEVIDLRDAEALARIVELISRHW